MYTVGADGHAGSVDIVVYGKNTNFATVSSSEQQVSSALTKVVLTTQSSVW